MGINHFLRLGDLTKYARSKNIVSPQVMVIITGLMLVFGSLGIMLGAYVEIAAIVLMVFLIPVAFFIHRFWEEKDAMRRNIEFANFMRNIAFFGALLIIYTYPTPWPYSI
jgi:uncharacterized membrane protein YphA (DoxX/SURF4 family)